MLRDASYILLGALIGLACAEPDATTAQCRAVCTNILCKTSPVGVPQQCTDDCVARHAEAAEISEACTAKYSALLGCLEPLECDDASYWNSLKGFDDPYECRDETEAFNAACPGLWFDPQ